VIERRPWAELVFHVLAQVPGGSWLAPSLHDARYTAQCAGLLGPAGGRPLGEDLAMLGALLTTHEAMVEAQALAWLFSSVEQASAASDRSLGELGPGDVEQPGLLPMLQGDASELLFCAALLEREPWASLPEGDPGALGEVVGALAPVAPRLGGCRLAALRPLGLRGRVSGGEIWVGVPGWGEGTAERCGWQAAHEATVLEVSERCAEAAASHEVREELAVALLARRAAEAGQSEAHARWLAAFAPPEAVLGERLGGLVEALARG